MKIYLLSTIMLLFIGQGHGQQAPKRLYIANDDHTDYMWTGDEAQYDSAFVHMLDYYLDQIHSTKNEAQDYQARFNCDGSFWVKAYQKYRSPSQFDRLVRAIRSRHISVPLNSLVSTYGAQPTEAVIRGMFDAGKMERSFGVRFPLAVCMENQTMPLGLSTLWAGSGAKFSWKGICGCASRMSKSSFTGRKHQLYKYNGLDGSGVIMKWYDLTGSNTSLGGYAETRLDQKPKSVDNELRQSIKLLSAMVDSAGKKKYPFDVAGAFGYGWDDLSSFVSPQFINAAKSSTTARIKVRVSNEEDFFEDIAKHYPKLPSESLSYGNEWDTYSVSMNETTARVRRATEKLRTAEALASIVSLRDRNFGQNLDKVRNAAWEAFGLYWEHDWTADGPVSQKQRAQWQIKMQQRITAYSDSLFQQASDALGKQLRQTANSRFYVFNPLNWARNDVADLQYDGAFPARVIDLQTNGEVPSQLVLKGGRKYLRIRAENVPSVGYKVFEIRQGAGKRFPAAATLSGDYLANAHYRIRLRKSGVITELIDSLAASRQLVKVINGKYLNDLGTTAIDEGNPLVIENAGPVSVTWKAVSGNPIPHTVRVTLFKDSPRIEIEDSIQANYKDLKTWAFSFALKQPTTRHEELGSVLTAKTDKNGGHYASQNARYDWLTFNHFADMSESGYGVSLSNVDCSFFKLGNSTPDSLDAASSQLNALAGGRTDALKDTAMLGIPDQFGQKDFLYQFALQTHQQDFDALAAMKFSMEHQNPLTAAAVTGPGSQSEQVAFSLLSNDHPGLLLWSIKPAEGGITNGLITRFWNMENRPANTHITLRAPVKEIWQTTHIETNEKKLLPAGGGLKTQFNQHELRTFRWSLK
ncbi:glycosyl hydrolase-related protein [Dyadobacter sp. CY261]|uniref:glycosyl hydrolase-related protein n=1 Tax=Dyadobacter sp. CY261 TaxID=2907203 RepID=UPI001F32B42F|nr:glycosyl hydrolase-related protein [Dyadobacter sp. CY261]MCF0069741.1 glycosyl hydrolase-related protein [Dyadobacter sp. CY261]